MRVHAHTAVAGPNEGSDRAWLAPLMRSEIDTISRACCCPAPAAYAVVIAPRASLPAPPEVLLCAHHMRAARVALSKPDVGVYDAHGRYVDLRDRFSAA